MGYPADFAWGTTSSSVQSEGVSRAADWWAWERDGDAPTSSDGSGFGVDFRDDLALVAELGCNAVRLTVEWARIEPVPDKVDRAVLDFYADVIDHARAVGLAPWVTLHSTSLPGWFAEDEGGFRDERAREYWWTRHVDRCAERFGASPVGWTPIEDPIGWAVRGYHLANRPPGLNDPTLLRDAVAGALEADHRAAQLLAAGGARTMAVRGVPTIFEHGPQAESTSRFWAGLLFDTWIDVLDSGELHVPDRAIAIRERWVDDFDHIGLVFDNPIGIDREGRLHAYPESARTADSGFAPLPEELGVLVHRVAERLPDRSLVIAGNGVSTRDDEWREGLLRETLDVVQQLVDDGINLHGYFHDTAIDGYEWRAGFETQRGLIDRDRSIKDSGQFFRAYLNSR